MFPVTIVLFFFLRCFDMQIFILSEYTMVDNNKSSNGWPTNAQKHEKNLLVKTSKKGY